MYISVRWPRYFCSEYNYILLYKKNILYFLLLGEEGQSFYSGQHLYALPYNPVKMRLAFIKPLQTRFAQKKHSCFPSILSRRPARLSPYLARKSTPRTLNKKQSAQELISALENTNFQAAFRQIAEAYRE